MNKVELLVHGREVSIEQQKPVQARVIWYVPCTYCFSWMHRSCGAETLSNRADSTNSCLLCLFRCGITTKLWAPSGCLLYTCIPDFCLTGYSFRLLCYCKYANLFTLRGAHSLTHSFFDPLFVSLTDWLALWLADWRSIYFSAAANSWRWPTLSSSRWRTWTSTRRGCSARRCRLLTCSPGPR